MVSLLHRVTITKVKTGHILYVIATSWVVDRLQVRDMFNQGGHIAVPKPGVDLITDDIPATSVFTPNRSNPDVRSLDF